MRIYIPTPHKINILASLLNREAQNILSVNFNISYHEYIMLLNLQKDIATNQMFLVHCTGLTKGAVSKILKSLTLNRIVKVRVSKKSGRDNAVHITSKGRNIVTKATHLLEKKFASFFEGFESEENIHIFNMELDKLITGLKNKKV